LDILHPQGALYKAKCNTKWFYH